jgi:hypothetical protein
VHFNRYTASSTHLAALMLLGVDIVLGPFITLIVFNPAKKELKRDLAIVVAVQLAALVYGLHTVAIARPVYIVFNTDRFDLVYANDLDPNQLDKVTDPRFRSVPWTGPRVIAARRPSDAQRRNEILFSAMSGGNDLPQMPQYYVPYVDEKAAAAARVQPLDALRTLNPHDGARVDEVARRHAGRAGGVGYLPLRARVKDLSVIVARDNADVLEIVPLAPWR